MYSIWECTHRSDHWDNIYAAKSIVRGRGFLAVEGLIGAIKAVLDATHDLKNAALK